MKIFLVSTLLLLIALVGFGCLASEKFDMTDIDKAIDLTKSESHKKLLQNFKSQYATEAASIQVASHSDNFEIIVTGLDSEEYTGGAAQYFLNKKTGEIKMGWHEAPVKIQ